MKRAFDLFFCCLIIPVAVPVCLIASCFIYAECRAPPFFWQSRLGRNEKPFGLFKLRTMAVGTVQAASHEVGINHILKVGRFLRATKIDELPQLWNVLKGEMSLIGPRPGLPAQDALTQARRNYGVFALLPGITGVSQVAGLDMSSPQELARVDAHYLGKWSLNRDLRILVGTFMGKGSGDAATRNHKAK